MKAILTATIVGMATVAGFVTLQAQRPPVTSCGAPTERASGARVITASQVVARPWYGPHNVYGIFLVPRIYREQNLSARLKVMSVEEPATLREPSTAIHGRQIAVVPGEFAVHAHVSTRFAVWSLLTGRFGDLGLPCHWTLVLTDKRSPS